jgi:predicted site-specific integrase-resolvase
MLPGVTVRTLQRWASVDLIPSLKLPSGQLRFRRADIEAVLAPRDSRTVTHV